MERETGQTGFIILAVRPLESLLLHYITEDVSPYITFTAVSFHPTFSCLQPSSFFSPLSRTAEVTFKSLSGSALKCYFSLQLISLCLAECLGVAGLTQKCLFNSQLTAASAPREHPVLFTRRLAGLVSFMRPKGSAVSLWSHRRPRGGFSSLCFRLHIDLFQPGCTMRRRSNLSQHGVCVVISFSGFEPSHQQDTLPREPDARYFCSGAAADCICCNGGSDFTVCLADFCEL